MSFCETDVCSCFFFLILGERPNDNCTGTSSVSICCRTLVCLYDYKCVFRVINKKGCTCMISHSPFVPHIGTYLHFILFFKWFPSYILGDFPKSLYTWCSTFTLLWTAATDFWKWQVWGTPGMPNASLQLARFSGWNWAYRNNGFGKKTSVFSFKYVTFVVVWCTFEPQIQGMKW